MIDTDKYEGHTEGPWDIIECSTTGKIWITDGEEDTAWTSVAEVDNHKNMNLIADSPLLLAEVKRLREELKQTRESLWWCYDNYRFDGHPMTDVDWNFIGNLLGADMESEEE